MTWTSKPKVDAQAVARAMCDAALQRRLVAEAAPEPADAMLPLSEYHDRRIKLHRRSMRDWTGEDAWHMLALSTAAFMVAFAGAVFVLTVR